MSDSVWPHRRQPPGSPVPGILQARTLEWVAISFSNAWKWKVKGKSLSRVRLLATPWTAAYQAPPSMEFSRQEYWSGVPLPSPKLKLVPHYYPKQKRFLPEAHKAGECCSGLPTFFPRYQPTSGTLAREVNDTKTFEIRLKSGKHRFCWMKTLPFTNKIRFLEAALDSHTNSTEPDT